MSADSTSRLGLGYHACIQAYLLCGVPVSHHSRHRPQFPRVPAPCQPLVIPRRPPNSSPLHYLLPAPSPLPPSRPLMRTMPLQKKKWYAVLLGRRPGLYASWYVTVLLDALQVII